MTQHEAEQLAAKLTRIWVPEEGTIDRSLNGAAFSYKAIIEVRSDYFVALWIQLLVGGMYYQLQTTDFPVKKLTSFKGDVREVPRYCPDVEAQEKFSAEWLEPFRRNCFLSGANIECTAHEQLQWYQWLQEKEAARA